MRTEKNREDDEPELTDGGGGTCRHPVNESNDKRRIYRKADALQEYVKAGVIP